MTKSTDPSTPKFQDPQAPTQPTLAEKALWLFGLGSKLKKSTQTVSKNEKGLIVSTGTGSSDAADDGVRKR